MSTALSRHQPLSSGIWDMIQRMAPVLKESRLFGVATDAQAVAVMFKAYELGLPFTAGFEFIHVIEGKPSLSPRGALALIYGSPEFAGMEINETVDSCTVTMRRRNGLVYTTTFTLADAQRAGLVKPNSGWEHYPNNMLRWRSIGYCADVVFPDVLGGLKRSDELGADLTTEGDVIEYIPPSVEENHAASPSSTEGETQRMARLHGLVQRFGADAIMKASKGEIPSTSEELDAVESVLVDASSDVDFYAGRKP